MQALDTPRISASKSLLALNRTVLKRIIEALTNHCDLNEYLHKIGYADDPRCMYGHDVESGIHVITECPRYGFFRKKTFERYVMPVSEIQLDAEKVGKLVDSGMEIML